MSRVSDLYLDELTDEVERLVEMGMDEDEAYDLAGSIAYASLPERLADMADQARQREKDERG